MTITSGKVDTGPHVLVRPEELPKRYHLVAPNGNTIEAIANQQQDELVFASYSNAEDFNNWFAENPNKRKLGKQGYNITAPKVGKYSVRPVSTPAAARQIWVEQGHCIRVVSSQKSTTAFSASSP
ncbi:hypothetical protein VOM14_10315 [Paraburkholderia sp. MPAMCS5]|uniref:hypothetical protein n=1 Tax=Paraburkholderia sp. MPAMCS5 TaxID=3112563 RepID=UPI002E184041|nr:hypothetical protein [Paraburkholderia sp. MPAMCS5]